MVVRSTPFCSQITEINVLAVDRHGPDKAEKFSDGWSTN
jgi:hypothetical protein